MPEQGRKKAGWTRVAFGDVVRKVADRVDPKQSGLNRYVAGEHMDTDDLRIRRWGTIGEDYLGPAFHMRFKPGQVLYGSRRTYLRKVATPDFEGITANTTFVLEPMDPNVLVPAFLPFIMQAESFHEHSIEQSKGSVNPYINFSDLARYEFALPPPNEQRRITKCLTSSALLDDALQRLERKHAGLVHRYVIDWFARLCASYPRRPIEAFGQTKMGRQKAPRYQRGKSPYPYLRVANVGWLRMQLDEIEQMDFTAQELERYRLAPGDILLTEGDLISEFNVGRPAIFEGGIDDCCFQNTLIRLRPNPNIPPFFLLLLLEGARLSHVFARAAKTTTVTHLGLGRFKEVELPLPPTRVQAALAQEFSELLAARKLLSERKTDARRVHRALLERVLA